MVAREAWTPHYSTGRVTTCTKTREVRGPTFHRPPPNPSLFPSNVGAQHLECPWNALMDLING